MTPIWIAISFILGIVVSSYLWKRDVSRKSRPTTTEKPNGMPFDRTQAVLPQGEFSLHKQLLWVAGDEMLVMPKVRLAELVEVPRKHERRDFYESLARTRYVNWVLCDAKSSKPTVVILAGNPDKKKREDEDIDDATENILRAASIPFIYLSPKQVYAPSDLKNKIRMAMAAFLKAEAAEATPPSEVQMRAMATT